MASRIALCISILALACTAPAHAVSPLPEKLYYRISWSGLPLGRIRVDTSETTARYHMVIDTKSKGVASVFSPFETVAQASGIISNGHYIPQRYESRANKSDEGKNRSTTILYDSNGRITERSYTPKADDPAWRPVVTIDKASAATDPITGFLAIRHMLRNHLAQGLKEANIQSYDGKRLATLTATHITSEGTTGSSPIIVTRITRTPIDGYTPKEWKKYKAGDPTLTVWFADNASLTPLRLELELMLGSVIVELSEE